MGENIPADVTGQLREKAAEWRKTENYRKWVELADGVIARFQPVFSPDHVAEITEEEFRPFLLDRNNHHWTGLHRSSSALCADMNALRKGLALLVDEGQALPQRVDQAKEMISGMGKNIASAILLIVYPDRYGVWNNRSEACMKRLGIWPDFDRGESFGSRYAKVNNILIQLRDVLDMDLWTLDFLWWYLEQRETEEKGDDPADDGPTPLPEEAESQQRFALERHLHDFLRDNWEHTELGEEWTLYGEPGDEDPGYEYPCDVGRIDLPAKHREKPRWLVVELKRNQTSDQTAGQLMRYIGWVKQHLAEEDDEVHGLIICREADEALRYALSTVPNTEIRLYRVKFYLEADSPVLARPESSE